jgi:CDP-diacylglycerol---glycerol-3-phosphate 3-phosphatidyltransferase
MCNYANLVSLSRVALCFVAISLLFVQSEFYYWLSFILTIIVIAADRLDGYLANKLNLASKFGGILDIACDRIVELAYWITFAVLGWIAIWIPFLFLVRGILVDSIRTYYQEQGLTAFGEKTMMKSKIGRFLVASNFSRFSYAVAKALAFCLLILLHISADPAVNWLGLNLVAHFCVYFSCAFCLVRGLPVLLEARDLLFRTPKNNNLN